MGLAQIVVGAAVIIAIVAFLNNGGHGYFQ